MNKPKTGKYSIKKYQCIDCKTIENIGTNHWGECYPFCETCRSPTVWQCLDPIPKGYGIPEPWRIMKLADLLNLKNR